MWAAKQIAKTYESKLGPGMDLIRCYYYNTSILFLATVNNYNIQFQICFNIN